MRPVFLLVLALVSQASLADSPPLERQQALLELLHQDCGSCHGMTLQGGLGPALLPSALEGKSASMLTATILQGRPGTAMPPWSSLLTQQEAEWLVTQLKQPAPPQDGNRH
jgi:cytochrome c55X